MMKLSLIFSPLEVTQIPQLYVVLLAKLPWNKTSFIQFLVEHCQNIVS